MRQAYVLLAENFFRFTDMAVVWPLQQLHARQKVRLTPYAGMPNNKPPELRRRQHFAHPVTSLNTL
jgi:hypothetical protein